MLLLQSGVAPAAWGSSVPAAVCQNATLPATQRCSASSADALAAVSIQLRGRGRECRFASHKHHLHCSWQTASVQLLSCRPSRSERRCSPGHAIQVDTAGTAAAGTDVQAALSPDGPYELGQTEVQLTVSSAGGSTSCSALLTVQVCLPGKQSSERLRD